MKSNIERYQRRIQELGRLMRKPVDESEASELLKYDKDLNEGRAGHIKILESKIAGHERVIANTEAKLLSYQ